MSKGVKEMINLECLDFRRKSIRSNRSTKNRRKRSKNGRNRNRSTK